LAVGEDDQLVELVGPAVLLDLLHAVEDALVHGRAARVDVEHVDAVDDVLNPGPVRQRGDGQDDLVVVGEGDNGDRVGGLELGQGGDGGLLDALEAADAGAVFLVHGAGDVQDQGEVDAESAAAAA